MKKITLFAIITLVLTLTACGQNATPPAIPTVVLDSNSSGKPAKAAGSATASAEVVPIHKAQLSFPLTGVVKTVEVSAGNKVTAGQTLVTLDTTILEAQVKQAEANLAATETQLKYLVRIGTDQEHLDSANADIDRAQAALDSARATLAEATLTAPFDGTIASVNISPAETVVPGQIVITLGDLTHFQVETTDLSERDVPNVQVGQTAIVFIEALNQQFTGKVTDISRISSMVGGDVVYKVTIELDTQSQSLFWGMSADVEIPSGK
jgi:RND family efflux transporter MFP subunit